MATSKRTIVVELQLQDKGAIQALGQLEFETKKFTKDLAALNKETQKNGFVTKEQAAQIGFLNASIRRNQTVIRELKNDLSGATAAGLRFRDKMADAAKAGLGAFGLNILTVSGAVVGLVSVFKNAVKTLADFDQALSRVSALGGEYATNIGKIAEVTKSVGIQFGFTALQSVEAVEALAKAGISVENILGGALQGALTQAAAGGQTVAEAAESMAKAMKQFGVAGTDATHVADLFANSANKALGEVSDITAALNQSGQVANQFGVSIEETVGTLTAFANAGLLGSDAGTSFRTMLIRLAKPTDDSAAAMDQLGIKAFDAQGAFVGIENLAGQLQTQLKDLTEEQRNSALATIFGTDAIRSASILYKEGAVGVANWTKEVSESGEAARIAAEKTNNLPSAIDKLGASYDALLLKEDGIVGFFTRVALGASAVLDSLSGNTDDARSIVAFTERVQEQYEKLGGTLKLTAEEGTEVMKNLRLISDQANDTGFGAGTEVLVESANEARQILRDLIAERRRLFATGNAELLKDEIERNLQEQAAAQATLKSIGDEISARAKQGEAATIAGKKEVDAITTVADKRAELEGKLAAAKKAREELNASDTRAIALADASIKSIVAEIDAIDGKTKALTAQEQKRREELLKTAKVVADLASGKDTIAKPQNDQGFAATDPNNDARADAAKQAAIAFQEAQEQVRLNEIQGITDFNAERAALDAEYLADKTIGEEEYAARSKALDDRIKQDKLNNQQAMLGATADFFGALANLAKEQSAEQKALATVQALINTYAGVAAVLGNPITIGPPPVDLAFRIASVAAVILNGLAAVKKIQGFAKGGLITDGQPIRRDNGDDVLITAKRDELIMNEPQQERAKRLYGDDIFKRLGIPGFAAGGRLPGSGSVRFVRGGGFITAPRPSPSDILGIEAAAEARATNFAPVVSVVEMNRVQQRVIVIKQLSTA